MAESTLRKVEGAGVLSKLMEMFFKGLDKALTDQAEYEEEMGVLKQINRIPIESIADGTKYTLTVKLSPVRGKDNYYFVEAETDAPRIDVSKINNKVLKIDNSNAKQFRDTIDKLLSNSKYTASMDRSEDNDSDTETVGELSEDEENPSKEGDLTNEGAFQLLLDEANKWFNEKVIVATAPGDKFAEIKVKFDGRPTPDECFINIDAVDSDSGKSLVEPEKIELKVKDDKLNIISADMFLEAIKSKIDQFCDDNNLLNPQYTIRSGDVVSATFIKDKEGIGLTAIKASDDLQKTMEIIYDVMDSDDFADQIPEGEEASFTITDEGGDYDIVSVDEIELSNHYIDVYQSVSMMYITLKSVQSMIGMKVFNADNFFNDLYLAVTDFQTKVSTWAFDKADVLEILKDPYKLVPTFEAYRNYSDNSDIPGIKDSLREEFNGLLTILDFISVNASEDELETFMQFSEAVHEVIDE